MTRFERRSASPDPIRVIPIGHTEKGGHMATRKNVNIELFRFLLSLFVVGYHTRLATDYGSVSLFEFGYFAVEFFFVLSGFLLARSLEKAYAADRNVPKDTGAFMWNKVRSFLPYHVMAIVLMVAVLGAYDAALLGEKLAGGGWTGIFLVQSFVVWTTCEGIVMPEWYLSTMLLVMLIVYPCARLLAKKIKRRVFIPVALICLLGVVAVAVGFGVNWAFSWNFSVDLRGFGEICLGMMLYYLATYLSKKEMSRRTEVVLGVTEGVCYVLALVLMCLPSDIMATIGIPLEILLAAVAITIAFSGHGIPSPGGRAGKAFGFLGAVSLPLYLLHPAVVELVPRALPDLPAYATVLVCFALSLAVTLVVYGVYTAIRSALKKKKAPPAQGGDGMNAESSSAVAAESAQDADVHPERALL